MKLSEQCYGQSQSKEDSASAQSSKVIFSSPQCSYCLYACLQPSLLFSFSCLLCPPTLSFLPSFQCYSLQSLLWSVSPSILISSPLMSSVLSSHSIIQSFSQQKSSFFSVYFLQPRAIYVIKLFFHIMSSEMLALGSNFFHNYGLFLHVLCHPLKADSSANICNLQHNRDSDSYLMMLMESRT